LPQDTTIYYDSNSNPVPFDSLPQEAKDLLKSIPQSKEWKEYSQPQNQQAENEEAVPAFFIFFIIAILAFGLIKVMKVKKEEDEEAGSSENEEAPARRYLFYDGAELDYPDYELEDILGKYFPYFTKLSAAEKQKFVQRLKKFISRKNFIIHDRSGFKEMPILISATAMQLSFGLEKFLLPNFYNINIHPEEFIGVHPTLRILEGNVSGHSINLSWKHFLKGFEYPDDGQNVGLHEFAHAYYYQFFETGQAVDNDFVDAYPVFGSCANKVFETEKLPGNTLYTDYGLQNFQEFWAESVEIFFEKPGMLKLKHEDLYKAMCELLNQDPLQHPSNLT
jgi:MtfA peptidase